MTTRRTTGRAARGAAGALAVAAALAACGGGQPGAAAVVDGRAIPSADVETATRELTGVLEGVTPGAVVQVLVQEPTVVAGAADAGRAVSEEQARTALEEQAAATGAGDGEFSAASVAVMRYLLAAAALQDAGVDPTGLQAELADLDVTVNPRFGTLDEAGALGPTTYPWLVADGAAEPAPAP